MSEEKAVVDEKLPLRASRLQGNDFDFYSERKKVPGGDLKVEGI